MTHGIRQHGSGQQARLTALTWGGANVLQLTGTVGELFSQVPLFSRHPFRAGSQENLSKDEIRKEPINITEEPVPVAAVSKVYSLIQHRDVLSSVFRALKIIDIDISAVRSTLILSQYGERMHWTCKIPGVDFDPGDTHTLVLRINCLNSVDMSTALEITFGWYRLICANGMMSRLKNSQLRIRHIQSLDPDDIASHLNNQLKQVDEDKKLFGDWYKTAVNLSDLVTWVDETVSKSWGPHAAARVWHIASSGMDGKVEPAKEKNPHDLILTHSSPVPGACAPVSNLFHVSQALSWIAGTRQTIPERLEYVKAIPRLMEPLTRDSH